MLKPLYVDVVDDIDVCRCWNPSVASPFVTHHHSAFPLDRTVSWLFCDVCGLDGKGGPAKWGFRDVQKLISEHLGLLKAEEPDLSIAGGVLTGDGKIRESVRDKYCCG